MHLLGPKTFWIRLSARGVYLETAEHMLCSMSIFSYGQKAASPQKMSPA